MEAQQQAENLDPGELIETAPDDEFALIELRLDWPPDLEIYPEHRQLWLRFFVLTGDPLAWIADRGEAWTSVTVDDEVLEIDVYVLLPAVRRRMEEHDGDVAAAIAPYATAVMQAGLDHEELLIAGDYHARVLTGEAPRLLDGLTGDHGAFGVPSIQARRSWGPIGFGALLDLVQEAFGPVDLDRSAVTLDPVDPPSEDCAACAGRSFGYPTELEEARERFCAPHDAAARAANAARIAHARESNPAGWRAIDKAAMRINKLPEPRFAPQPPRIVGETPARNDPCPCGSGKKYKRCHGA
jgi:SEC-C motif